ncbi:type II 3-dehydroquinate dehydratase [Gammaproteobacteria bacterium]|nr:type II 3-dehydroquinate dehydratase [Gammaproteobacteria bacterium]
MKILLINGPNLNLLGSRETDIYGNTSLEQIESNLCSIAEKEDCNLTCFQSNAEHELINAVHSAGKNNFNSIIINPAAYTHTSIALRDAFSGVGIPFYEVHISDIYKREEFRKFSYLSDIAEKVFCGLGIEGYELALMEAIGSSAKEK